MADDKGTEVTIWTQGGAPESMDLDGALDYLEGQLDVRDTAWEQRIPGEEVSESDWIDHPTLREAVRAVWPESKSWQRRFGITDTQLAFLAQEAGLILATGAEDSELYGDEDENNG